VVLSTLVRLEGICELVQVHLTGLHPPEKQWKKYVLDGTGENKEKIAKFIKCEKLISIGTFSSVSSKFYDAIKGKCNESTNERVRQWFESGSADDGVLGRYVIAQKQAKLALAVAVAAKAIWIKIPKVGDDRKKKKELVAATKKHIAAAKVDKALCALVCMHVSDVLGTVWCSVGVVLFGFIRFFI
jgi:hypothetical protein